MYLALLGLPTENVPMESIIRGRSAEDNPSLKVADNPDYGILFDLKKSTY